MSDESSAVGDFLKDLRSAWSNRIANPLIGSFALSWAAINYRTIVVLLSGSTFKEKFLYIDSDIYPDFQYAFLKCFVLPLTFALLYIYALPKPTERVYQRALRHQRELNNIAKSIADEKLLNAVESLALMEDAARKIDAAKAEAAEKVERAYAESLALMEGAEKKIAVANAEASERVKKADAERRSALALAKEETARAAKELGSVERLLQTHQAELGERDSQFNRKLSEVVERHDSDVRELRSAIDASERRAASLSWALTFERAVTASYEDSQMEARLFELLTAKQVKIFIGSMDAGSIKFTREHGFIDSQGYETKDWLSWTLSENGRIAIYNSAEREVASFIWKSGERRWQGSTSGRDAALRVQQPSE